MNDSFIDVENLRKLVGINQENNLIARVDSAAQMALLPFDTAIHGRAIEVLQNDLGVQDPNTAMTRMVRFHQTASSGFKKVGQTDSHYSQAAMRETYSAIYQMLDTTRLSELSAEYVTQSKAAIAEMMELLQLGKPLTTQELTPLMPKILTRTTPLERAAHQR